MKKLKEQVSLEGKLETITVSELRAAPGEVLQQVALGKVYVVEREGKPAMILSRPPGVQLVMHVDAKGKTSYSL